MKKKVILDVALERGSNSFLLIRKQRRIWVFKETEFSVMTPFRRIFLGHAWQPSLARNPSRFSLDLQKIQVWEAHPPYQKIPQNA
jgi:hypothetical protein